jgi:hypothetical protein
LKSIDFLAFAVTHGSSFEMTHPEMTLLLLFSQLERFQ